MNLGSPVLFLAVTVSGLILMPLTNQLIRIVPSSIAKRLIKQKNNIMWGSFIDFFVNLSLEICISTPLMLSNPVYSAKSSTQAGEVASTYLAYLIGPAFIAFIIAVPIILTKNFKKLKSEPVETKYGSLWVDIKIRPWPLAFTSILILRRIIFAATALYVEFVIVQKIIFYAIVMGIAIFMLHVRPFYDPRIGRIELMNEFVTLLYLYPLNCFFEIFDPPERE
jgi:hypothetical protein